MADCSIFDPLCQVGQAVTDSFERLVQAAAESAAKMVVTATTWWTTTGTVNLQQPAVSRVQALTVPLIAIILTASVIWQAIRMMLARKGEPALAIAEGLARFAVWNAVGVAVFAGALRAGDELAKAWLGTSATDLAGRMAAVVVALIVQPQAGTSLAFAVLLMAIVIIVLSLVQWAIGWLRQAALLVLVGLIPLAASGSLNQATRPWLSRLLGWAVALACWKLAAALIYAIGFELIGTGQDLSALVTGMFVIVLSVIALPAMLRFFAWGVGGLSGGGGGGLLAAAGATGSLLAAAAMTRRDQAVTHAAYMDQHGPSSGGGPSGGGPAGPGGALPGGPGRGPAGAPGGTGPGAGTAATAPAATAPAATAPAATQSTTGTSTPPTAPAAVAAAGGRGSATAATAAVPHTAAVMAAAHLAGGAAQAAQAARGAANAAGDRLTSGADQ
jgi:type IV secretion system protein TrbL